MDKMFRMEKGSKFDTNPYLFVWFIYLVHRAVGRSENPGVPLLFDEHTLSPLVEIGLNDLPKSWGAMAPPAPPETTPLVQKHSSQGLNKHLSNRMGPPSISNPLIEIDKVIMILNYSNRPQRTE